jgi:hypothetical protein
MRPNETTIAKDAMASRGHSDIAAVNPNNDTIEAYINTAVVLSVRVAEIGGTLLDNTVVSRRYVLSHRLLIMPAH